MKRYSIDKGSTTGMKSHPTGDFVKYEDLLRLLKFIQNGEEGASPTMAVINGIFDFTAEETANSK